MRKVFIINPFAGKEKIQKDLISELNRREIKYYVTAYSGEATEIAKREAAIGDEVTIYSCGGEGTNYEVVNGVIGKDNVTLGIVPCGTGNDFIKYFKSKEPFLDLDNQFEGRTFYIEAIKVTLDGKKTVYSINSCSAGMDAMVCENTDMLKKIPMISSSLAYTMAIPYTLFQPFKTKLDFEIDGKEMCGIPSLFAVIANAPYYGGGYKCAPNANPSDEKLNYSIIATASKLKMVSVLDKYKKGTHIDLPFTYSGECEVMEYKSDNKVTFNIDGEIFHVKSAKCEVVKNAIKLMLPKTIADEFETVLKSVKGVQFA